MVPIKTYCKNVMSEFKSDLFSILFTVFLGFLFGYFIVTVVPILMILLFGAAVGGLLFWFIEAGWSEQ